VLSEDPQITQITQISFSGLMTPGETNTAFVVAAFSCASQHYVASKRNLRNLWIFHSSWRCPIQRRVSLYRVAN
jgi:hypothetical protein